jgi:hypothetical protein
MVLLLLLLLLLVHQSAQQSTHNITAQQHMPATSKDTPVQLRLRPC